MEMFEEMELELIRFGAEDILTTSGNPLSGNTGGESGGGEMEEPLD